MYLDAMQNILAHAHTLVVDDKLKGLVPFLPLEGPGSNPVMPAAPAQSKPGQAQTGQSQTGQSQTGQSQTGQSQTGVSSR
jgi:hypothetical protein